MAETHVVRWRAEGKALVVGEPSLLRVDIGYGEMGEPENRPLGHWIGMAASERDAGEQAMDAVWDCRLDVVCSPRIHARKLEGEEAARERRHSAQARRWVETATGQRRVAGQSRRPLSTRLLIDGAVGKLTPYLANGWRA